MGYVELITSTYFSLTTNIIKYNFILVYNLEINSYLGGALCSYSCCALTHFMNEAMKSMKYTTLM